MGQDERSSFLEYGIVAVTPHDTIIHFCGYQEIPPPGELERLEFELRSDQEFGITDKEWKLRFATEKELEYFRGLVEGR